MELSPGLELTWWLASREALHAQAAEVEPDHFFCALLTFAEMSDSDLQTVARLDLAQEKLVELRDNLRWHLRLRELDTRTAELRHAVRRAAPHGDGQAAGATLHRSEAALRVFEAASALAREGKEKLDPHHLLYALLEAPTPAMALALGSEAPADAAPADLASADAAPADTAQTETPLPETLVGQASAPTPQLDRYTRAVQPKAGPGAAADDSLRAALVAATHSPRLLICSPATPLWAFMGSAVQNVPPPGRVAVVLVADLSREGWLGLLAEARRTATLLLVDLTQQQPAIVQQVVAALAAVVQAADGVFVAVEADHFHQYIQLKPEWANAFNPLYL